jgi:hypothetical protein
MYTKVFFYTIVVLASFGIMEYYKSVISPEVNTNLALGQFESNSNKVRLYRESDMRLQGAMYVSLVALGLILFWRDLMKLVKFSPLCLLFLVGCMSVKPETDFTSYIANPYCKPIYEEIQHYEDAFLIPLEGDISQQKIFGANELRKAMVSVKRIEIPHQILRTGWATYVYKPTVRLIKVDKSPKTVIWAPKGEVALWVESRDSVMFATGFSCTARIENTDDAITFLSHYPNGSLEGVLNNEVKQQFQAILAKVCARYDMDKLRAQKNEIIESIEKGIFLDGKQIDDGVIDFFKTRGIQITNIAQFGGFEYQDPDIEKSITAVFKAQQEKQIALAEVDAQRERNEAVKLKAEGLAEAVKLEANGKAEARKMEAGGEAEAIQVVADAKKYETEQAKADPEFYSLLKKYEVEKQRLEKWDGKYPIYYFGAGDTPEFLLSVPTPPVQKPVAK